MSVVEGSDGKLELVGVVHHGLQVGHGVAVGVDVDLATESSAQGLPEDLLRQVFLHVLHANSFGLVAPVILFLNDISCLLKGMSELVALAQSAEGPPADLSIDALGVLSTGHFHVAPVTLWVGKHVGSADLAAAIGLAHSKLEKEGLTTNVVRRTGEDEGSGDTTRLDDLDLRIEGVDAVNGAHPWCNVARHLVGIVVAFQRRQAVDAGVGMHVDDACGKLTTLSIIDDSTFWQILGGNARLYFLDQAVLEQNICLDPLPAMTGARILVTGALDRLADPDSGILNERRRGSVDIARVLVATEANWVLGLGTELLASVEVGVELLDGQLRGGDAATPDLLPLGEDDQPQTGDGGELEGSRASHATTRPKSVALGSWGCCSNSCVGRQSALLVHLCFDEQSVLVNDESKERGKRKDKGQKKRQVQNEVEVRWDEQELDKIRVEVTPDNSHRHFWRTKCSR